MPWRVIQGVNPPPPPPSAGWVQVSVQERHFIDEHQLLEGGAEVRPPPKDSPAGGKPHQQCLVEGGEPLHAPLRAGHLLPDGKEVRISCHPACETEVE